MGVDTTDLTPDFVVEVPAPAREAPGTRIDRYEIEAVIGSGGAGDVYRARDVDLGRPVAITLVRGHGPPDALLREAQAMARLSHPNVVVVYQVGAFRDRVYLAMEYVDGETLRGWMAAGPRPWRAVRAIFAAAARGLSAAHRAGIVHRDFKPENVLIGGDGRVRVGDFGLAGDAE
jgi:serine/threonine protein kinase